MTGSDRVMDKTCAYCAASGPFTREHIWPDCIGHRTPSYLAQFSEKADRVFGGDLVIKDVCESCNNGPLSIVDSWFCSEYDRTFDKVVRSAEEFTLEYDYELLSRALLKISYNAARSAGVDNEIMAQFAPFILGVESRPNTYDLFLQLIIPAPPRGEDRAEVPPRSTRAGRVMLPSGAVKGAVARVVAVNSFYFVILVYPKNPNRRARRSVTKEFEAMVADIYRLRPGIRSIEVTASRFDTNQIHKPHLGDKYAIYRKFFDEFKSE
jgi:hypothetical protein